jgi:flagellar biosynthesis protein FlhF
VRIRRITAATMADALREVKAALGPDAVLLDTSTAGGAVTITAAVDDDAPPPAGDDELRREVQELTALVRTLVPALCDEAAPSVRALAHGLATQGVDGAVAAALVRDTAAAMATGCTLADALAATLPLGVDDARRVRLIVGPPGEGKTTVLVQLAVRERQAGRSVALIGADDARIGAGAALSAYGRALDVPVLLVREPGALARALAALADVDRVFVDTHGATASQKDELGELARLADEAGPDAGRTLVLGAGAGSTAAARTCHAYAAFGLDGCVVTKLDAAPGAPVLGELWRHRVPVTHLATGRRIPTDLAPATAERLARCLLAA